jgi:hypothetical protein
MLREPSGWGYDWATLFLGDINTGTWSSRLVGVSDETVIYGYGPCATLTSDRLHCKLQTRPLVRDGALHDETRTCQTEENLKSGHWPQRGGGATPRRPG